MPDPDDHGLPGATRACPVCARPSEFRFRSRLGRAIYACVAADCSHLHTPIVESQQGVHVRPQDIAEESDRSLALYGERNRRLLHRLLVELGADKDRPMAILDFGAGDGHVARSFREGLGSAARIYCVESEAQCAALHAAHGLLPLRSLRELPEPVDLIYSIEVVEHLEDPRSVLCAMRDALKPGGKLFLSTPPGHPVESMTNAYDNPTHLHFFTPLSLNRLLGEVGFEPMAFRHFPEMYPLPQAPGTVERARLLLRRLARGLGRRLRWPSSSGPQGTSPLNSAASAPTWVMPPDADGFPYPYHLVGFSRLAGRSSSVHA